MGGGGFDEGRGVRVLVDPIDHRGVASVSGGFVESTVGEGVFVEEGNSGMLTGGVGEGGPFFGGAGAAEFIEVTNE